MFLQACELQKTSYPRAVITTNEVPEIARFKTSKKILLGHSIFIRASTVTPMEQKAFYYAQYDYYFVPTTFYMRWTIQSILDTLYYDNTNIYSDTYKTIIPGGYVKLPQLAAKTKRKIGVRKNILYVPSVFSHYDPGHTFYEIGEQLIIRLSKQFPKVGIICRPHPTDLGRPQTVAIQKLCKNLSNGYFDSERTPNPKLYYKPDILITDMSGFAFAHEYCTRLKPIFYIQEHHGRNTPRLLKMAHQFAHVVSNLDDLVDIVSYKLQHHDFLDEETYQQFKLLFSNKYNNIKSLVDDLLRIKDDQVAAHWIRLPLSFS